MIQRRALGHLNREPLYNTRAVAQQTNVPPDTFRAWERRYGIPRPFRTSGNQRLYSERDIGVVAWLRDRTAEGMTISQAVQRLRLEHPDILRDATSAPEYGGDERAPNASSRLEELQQRLVDALMDFDDFGSDRILDETIAQFSVEEACLSVIRPALCDIGDRWERGEIPAGLEHFATRVIMRRLSLIFNMVGGVSGRGKVVAVCAPGEEHEVGLMMLSIFLGRRNWRVI
ncbi:MAG: MerR family transcriptional regulator, partial [Chloroflexi bacterium]